MNNTSALTIRTDPETKKKIADFAASVGLSTSAFATAVLIQAVKDQRVVLTPSLTPTPYLEALLKEAEEDIKAGRISKSYDDVDEMFRDLEDGTLAE